MGKAVIYAASVAVAVVLTVALVYSYPMLSSSDSSVADSSMLAKKPAAKKPDPVKFGDEITLKNPYNMYVTTTLNGSPSTAGYLGKNDVGRSFRRRRRRAPSSTATPSLWSA